MCIYLGGRKTGMPQDFLDGIQVGTSIQHMGGKGMSQYMWTSVFHGSNKSQVVVYHPVNKSGVKGLALVGQ